MQGFQGHTFPFVTWEHSRPVKLQFATIFWSQSGSPWKYLSGFDNMLETTCRNCKSNWMSRQIIVAVCDYDGVEWGQLSWPALWIYLVVQCN